MLFILSYRHIVCCYFLLIKLQILLIAPQVSQREFKENILKRIKSNGDLFMDILAVFFFLPPPSLFFWFVWIPLFECTSRATVAEQMHQSPPRMQSVSVSGSALNLLNIRFLSGDEEEAAAGFINAVSDNRVTTVSASLLHRVSRHLFIVGVPEPRCASEKPVCTTEV